MTTTTGHYAGEVPNFFRSRLGRRAVGPFTYGVPLRVGIATRQWLLTSPEDVFHVLVKCAENYSKSRELTDPRAQRRVGGGLLGRRGAKHHERRRSLQPLYTQRSVQAYCELVEGECDTLHRGWSDGDTLDLAAVMGKLARRVLFVSLFGALSEERLAILDQAIRWRRAHTERVYFSRVPRFGRLPTPSRWRDERAQRVFADQVRLTLRQIDTGESSGPLLEGISRITLPDGNPMTESDVIDEVLSLMSTGHETITEWMTWSWVLLAKHPDFEVAWRDEIAGLGASSNWMGVAPSLAPLTYGLLEETLRLYPPTWLYGRVPLVKDVLPSGLTVSPSDNVLLCPYLMHRHPGAFPDPERFNPMRYKALDWGQHAGRTLIPFGAGAHRCIGDKFARMETMLALVSLAKVVRFERLENTPIVPDPGLTLGILGGLPVRIHRVQSDAA